MPLSELIEVHTLKSASLFISEVVNKSSSFNILKLKFLPKDLPKVRFINCTNFFSYLLFIYESNDYVETWNILLYTVVRLFIKAYEVMAIS